VIGYWYFFLPPLNSFAVRDGFGLALFSGTALAIIRFAELQPNNVPTNTHMGIVGSRACPEAITQTVEVSEISEGERQKQPVTCLEFINHTLFQMPSMFARIVYLASFSDPTTGLYRNQALARIFGEEEANRVLREIHKAALKDWIYLALEEKSRDFVVYLESGEQAKPAIAGLWLNTALQDSLLSEDLIELERRAFSLDFKVVLSIYAKA